MRAVAVAIAAARPARLVVLTGPAERGRRRSTIKPAAAPARTSRTRRTDSVYLAASPSVDVMRLRLWAGVGISLALAIVATIGIGLPHRPFGMVGLAVLFALVPSQVAVALSRRIAPGVVAALVGTLLLPVAVSASPVPHDRLGKVLDELAGPLRALESARGGSQACLDGCPSVERLYLVDADAAVVTRQIAQRSTQLGFRLLERRPGVLTGASGRVRLEATVVDRETATQLVLRASAR
jgi:hypothetical protein